MTEPHRVEPLTVAEVAALFKSADFPWRIAGGWGLDLFLGHQTRPHEDTDVLVLRRDQRGLQAHLEDWDLHAADPPGTGSLRPWTAEEQLDLPVHEVWCRKEPHNPWQLEIVLGDTSNGHWVFRRNANVTRALDVLAARQRMGSHTSRLRFSCYSKPNIAAQKTNKISTQSRAACSRIHESGFAKQSRPPTPNTNGLGAFDRCGPRSQRSAARTTERRFRRTGLAVDRRSGRRTSRRTSAGDAKEAHDPADSAKLDPWILQGRR